MAQPWTEQEKQAEAAELERERTSYGPKGDPNAERAKREAERKEAERVAQLGGKEVDEPAAKRAAKREEERKAEEARVANFPPERVEFRRQVENIRRGVADLNLRPAERDKLTAAVDALEVVCWPVTQTNDPFKPREYPKPNADRSTN